MRLTRLHWTDFPLPSGEGPLHSRCTVFRIRSLTAFVIPADAQRRAGTGDALDVPPGQPRGWAGRPAPVTLGPDHVRARA